MSVQPDPITQAIYQRMANDANLTTLLSVYDSAPAIFTADPIPFDAKRPYIMAANDVTVVPFDTKTTLGREIARDIQVVCDATGSHALLEAIAERVRTLFHRYALAIAGFATIIARVVGPISTPSDPRIQVHTITLHLTLEEA